MKKKLVVLIVLVGLWSGVGLAMTLSEVEKTCPLCGTVFKTTMAMSGTSFGMRLDLKPIGPIAAPWPVPVCPNCGFVLYESSFYPEEKEKLQKIVQSSEYQALRTKGASPYYLYAQLIYQLQHDDLKTAQILLKASWEVEDQPAEYQRYLSESLAHFEKYLGTNPRHEKDWVTAMVLKGEIMRQLSQFDKSLKHFSSLKDQPEFQEEIIKKIVTYELELVAKKDSSPHEVPEGP